MKREKFKVISPFPYYGGKYRMAEFIVSLLDFDNTDIYCELYGGGARVLMNKPRHKKEFYNDFGEHLTVLLTTIQNPVLFKKLLDCLAKTSYTEEAFNEAKEFVEYLTMSIEEREQREFDRFLKIVVADPNVKKILHQKPYNLETPVKGKKEIEFSENIQNRAEEHREKIKGIIGFIKEVCTENDNTSELLENLVVIQEDHEILVYAILDGDSMPLFSTDLGEDDIIKLSASTYMKYLFSRDGMGKNFSGSKFKSDIEYHKRFMKLDEVHERLQGVNIWNHKAELFLDTKSEVHSELAEYLDNERVMFYLDPSYIKPTGKKSGQDLGKGIYSMSYTIEQHEALLKMIYKAKAKILISNYDVEPYTTYLTEENGWWKLEFKTNTSVGGKKDNERIEVVYGNYDI